MHGLCQVAICEFDSFCHDRRDLQVVAETVSRVRQYHGTALAMNAKPLAHLPSSMQTAGDGQVHYPIILPLGLQFTQVTLPFRSVPVTRSCLGLTVWNTKTSLRWWIDATAQGYV